MSEPEITLPLETVRRLFRVFDFWWNHAGVTESDRPDQCYISPDDAQFMSDLCEAVEDYDSIQLLRIKLDLDEEL